MARRQVFLNGLAECCMILMILGHLFCEGQQYNIRRRNIFFWNPVNYYLSTFQETIKVTHYIPIFIIGSGETFYQSPYADGQGRASTYLEELRQLSEYQKELSYNSPTNHGGVGEGLPSLYDDEQTRSSYSPPIYQGGLSYNQLANRDEHILPSLSSLTYLDEQSDPGGQIRTSDSPLTFQDGQRSSKPYYQGGKRRPSYSPSIYQDREKKPSFLPLTYQDRYRNPFYSPSSLKDEQRRPSYSPSNYQDEQRRPSYSPLTLQDGERRPSDNSLTFQDGQRYRPENYEEGTKRPFYNPPTFQGGQKYNTLTSPVGQRWTPHAPRCYGGYGGLLADIRSRIEYLKRLRE